MLTDEGYSSATWHCFYRLIYIGECVAALMSAPDSLNSNRLG
uniref:Uncharacterized protein n=1 Tax=Yersinia enterocolitica W22703 TaxID=913028 RepID=F4N3G1_YEREN|nr:unknown protein [Yersinia enterocolitica W22703]